MKTSLFFLFFLVSSVCWSQDTFSIVAVDTITGEIGSAGASCIDETAIAGGAIIISDVIPGRGGIHTQSYWSATNQQNAHNRMMEGLSPQEIIDWLVDNDVSNNPTIRQYGIVDTDPDGHPRTAAYTGTNCLNYKNHITGPNYSIQGNILLGQQILDSIEARFLNTEGSFPEKLMAALQGANVVGADTRCTSNGTSSLSAFIRIARPGDLPGMFYCDLNVPSLPAGMEPIDSLQTLFDAWLEMTVGISQPEKEPGFYIYPNPAKGYLVVGSWQLAVGNTVNPAKQLIAGNITLTIMNMLGQAVERIMWSDPGSIEERIDIRHLQSGIYVIVINEGENNLLNQKLIVY